MRCDEFAREWQLTQEGGRLSLSEAAANHLATCARCQDLTLDGPGLDEVVRAALHARAARVEPRSAAVVAAMDAAVAAMPRRAPTSRSLPGRAPLHFVAIPPTLAGWAVAAVLLIMVGLLGRAPLGTTDAQIAAQTATAVAARPSATPSPTVSPDAPPTAVSMARTAGTPLPQP